MDEHEEGADAEPHPVPKKDKGVILPSWWDQYKVQATAAVIGLTAIWMFGFKSGGGAKNEHWPPRDSAVQTAPKQEVEVEECIVELSLTGQTQATLTVLRDGKSQKVAIPPWTDGHFDASKYKAYVVEKDRKSDHAAIYRLEPLKGVPSVGIEVWITPKGGK